MKPNAIPFYLSEEEKEALRALPDPQDIPTMDYSDLIEHEDALIDILYRLRSSLPFAPGIRVGLTYAYGAEHKTYRVVAETDDVHRVIIERLHTNSAGPAGGVMRERVEKIERDFIEGRCTVIEEA